ncbi:hypothetical protein ACSBR2_040192 [Camellia fascicularis]
MFNKMLLRSASTPIIKKSSWVNLKELSPQALVRSSSSSYFNSSWSPLSNSFSERRSPVSSISNSIKKISRKREEAENNLLLIRRSSSSAPNGCSEAVFHDPIYQETMVVDQELDQDYCSSLVGGSGGGGSGVGGGGGGGGDDEGDGANDGFESIDEYYQKMIKAHPGNALLLGNYARFLKEVRGEVEKALEYCERAMIISGNEDGNVLSLYGELIWDAHKDASRAQFYFDQALLASPHDCDVMASYARFLWDAEDEDEDEEEEEEEEEEKVEEQEQYDKLNNGNSSSPPPANFLQGLAFPPPPPPIAAP